VDSMPTRHGGIFGKPCFNLAARPLLTQNNRTAVIEPHDVERVLPDGDADYGDSQSVVLSQAWRAPRLGSSK
jgi:hypothetical protein